MKIKLLEFVKSNDEINDLKNEADFKKELNRLIANIITGEEEFSTNNKTLVDKLDIKYKKNDSSICGYYGNPFRTHFRGEYMFKLNLTNIKKVQNYINKEEK